MKIPAVYGISGVNTGRIYVGQSRDVAGRWKSHLWDLEHGTHPVPDLQRDWDKMGCTGFVFLILTTCPPNELRGKEREIGRSLGANGEQGYNRGKL